MDYIDIFKKGSGIHIKKKNRGKFTDYCGGKVTEECIQRGKHSSNPTTRKRATFAANARKWKHQQGGLLSNVLYDSTDINDVDYSESIYDNDALLRVYSIEDLFYSNLNDNLPVSNDFESNALKWNNVKIKDVFLGTPQLFGKLVQRKFNYAPVKGDITQELKDLVSLFKKHGINVKVTSGYRNTMTASGKPSWHSKGWAIDIVPSDGNFENLEKAVFSNPEILEHFHNHGLGILRETTPEIMRKTGATGKHWHIGPDNWAISDFNKMLQQYSYNFSNPNQLNNPSGRLKLVINGNSHTAQLYNGNNLLMSTQITVGKNGVGKHVKGNKTTPVGNYTLVSRENSSGWTYDYGDGKGPVKAYGPLFFRLNGAEGKSGIGIHGTSRPEMLGKNDSSGCIRFSNEDLLKLDSLLTLYGGHGNVDVLITQ